MFARFMIISAMLCISTLATVTLAQESPADPTALPLKEISDFPKPQTSHSNVGQAGDDSRQLTELIRQQFDQGFSKFQQTFGARLNDLEKIAVDHDARLGELKDQIGNMESLMEEQFGQQQQMLDAISQPDSQGSSILRLDSIMQKSPEFREQMAKIVHDSLPSEGEFVVNNKTDTAQLITVNQQQYTILPQSTFSLKVPLGTVSTQLPGQAMFLWTIEAPNYRQSIDIAPLQNTWNRRTALRPRSTTAYYVDSASNSGVYPAPTSNNLLPVTSYPIPTMTSVPTSTYYSPLRYYYPYRRPIFSWPFWAYRTYRPYWTYNY